MKRLIAFTLLAVCVCWFLPCLAGGAWIAAIPEQEEIAKGEPVSVTIRLGWWEASPGSAIVRITYDSRLLQLDNTDVLDERVCAVSSAKKGELTLVCSPSDDQPDTGETDLIRIAFKTTKTGKASVSPTIVSIADARWVAISSESSPTVIGIR